MKLFVLFLLSCAAFAQTPSGDAKRGQDLYNTKYRCYTCHGFSGQNGPGARLVPMKMPYAAFAAFVRHPRAPRPGRPTGAGQLDRMPAYTAKVLPDQELADIYAHIKALPEAPAAKNIPLLNEISAQKH